MGKADRVLVIELNLSLSCFGLSALYICQNLTLPAGPASRHCSTQGMSMIIVGLILNEVSCPPPPFPI